MFPLVVARTRGETEGARQHVSERLGQLACLWSLADERGAINKFVFGRRRNAFVHGARPGGWSERVPRVCFRPGKSGSVPAAANFANVSGRGLADVGGGGSALCGWPARRDDVRERSTGP